MEVDVLVAGGGPAGLSAALILGRCHRTTLLCDEGRQRNLSSQAIHGLLGREGTSPSALLDTARQEITRYNTVSVHVSRVIEINPGAGKFAFVCADGTTGSATKVLLATGLVDELPDLAGIETLYGLSVHHCLYCDGFEYAGKAVAAYGKGDKGAELAIMMKHWIRDVVACSDGTEVGPEAMQRLQEFKIPLRAEAIKSLDGKDGELAKIVFGSGPDLPSEGLFFSTGCIRPPIFSKVSVASAATKEASLQIPIRKRPRSQAFMSQAIFRVMSAVAIGEGAQAAVAINKALLRRDGFCK